MKKLAIAVLALLVGSSAMTAETVVELFQKAKAQVKAGSYGDALKTLDALDAETAKAGHESERKMVEPPLAFYRGVCDAALGKKEGAKGQFVAYLGFVPNASIDSSMYPKKAVAAFEEARQELGPAPAARASIPSLASAYAAYKLTTPPAPDPPGEGWANGPVRVLLTSDEKRDFSRLSDPVTRSEFITRFWASRDPKPETPENEFRLEVERRIAFADANFTQDEVRGSLTDRGMVFILLGPPTYIGRRPIGAGEDAAAAAGMSTSGRHDAEVALVQAQASSPSGKTTTASQTAIADRANAPGSQALDSGANWQEVWHYRRELLPAGVPYQQVDFDFITRKGYGKNVLQRNSAALATIEAAKKPVKIAKG
jgi:GWxTD domain-containing protein